MTLGELVRALWKRSGMKQEDYASEIEGGRTHFNAVVNLRADASPDMADRALRFANLKWSDVIMPPLDPVTAEQDEAVLRIIQAALASDGEDRQHVLEQAAVLRIRSANRESLLAVKSRKRKKSTE